ncbi:MAG: YggS family pyridoxal phosphate-dependent enzyme [Paludibacteraceae bacterium]|nr:YggS family pyridoxal phosphate-dependent enzyme [Paludibacteraceae bacterium]
MQNSIVENIRSIRATIPTGVELLCVSKFHPATDIMQAYQAGERLFGESRVQELVQKHAQLPHDIQWHFIGHLQTNKIRPIVPFVSLIHGIDSFHLLESIDKEAAKVNRKIRVLIEVHVAQETTKFGFSPNELIHFFATEKWQDLPNIEICGLMGMASFTDNLTQIQSEFHQIKTLFDEIRSKYFVSNDNFNILSMGMSDDYKIAITEGSNLVRIGTNIFGKRN